MGIGIHEYNLSGTLYTGNLPTPNYVYGNGTVFKRNSASVMVVLYGALQEPIATNYSSDGQKWLGWNQHALKSDLALQTQTLYKNVVIYRIGNIAMLSAPSWVRKEELAGVTIPTGYRPVKTISIPFTQQNFNDGAYCDVSTEGKINYTGTSPIVINAIWFCT